MKWHAIAIGVYLIGLLSYTQLLRGRSDGPPPAAALAEIPLEIGDYIGREDTIDERSLEVLGADETVFREYWRPDGPPIWVFLGYFGEPKENSQIHSPKHCYPGSGWSIYGESNVEVPFGAERINATCLLVTDGEYDETVFYWFLTDTGIVTDEFELKWVQMKNALLQRSRRSTFVRFSTPLEADDRAAAEAELQRFIDAFGPYISAALDKGKGGV